MNKDTLHEWRLNLNNNTLYILSLESTKGKIIFHMNARLEMCKYCYS